METPTLLDRLKSIDLLIVKRSTGNAHKLAEKLGITERSVYNYLNLMKTMGAPIVFSSFYQSYTYKDNGSFHIGFLNTMEYSHTIVADHG